MRGRVNHDRIVMAMPTKFIATERRIYVKYKFNYEDVVIVG